MGVISRVGKTMKNTPILLYKKCETIGLENHTKSCVIVMPNTETIEEQIILNCSHAYRPIKIHIDARGRNLICLRDLEF